LPGLPEACDRLLQGIELDGESYAWTDSNYPKEDYKTIPCNEFFNESTLSRYALFSLIKSAPESCSSAMRIRENLEKLELTKAKTFPDLLPLTALSNLKFLTFQNNETIKDITPLEELKKLEKLDISGCEVPVDLSPLKKLEKFKNLILENCHATLSAYFRSFLASPSDSTEELLDLIKAVRASGEFSIYWLWEEVRHDVKQLKVCSTRCYLLLRRSMERESPLLFMNYRELMVLFIMLTKTLNTLSEEVGWEESLSSLSGKACFTDDWNEIVIDNWLDSIFEEILRNINEPELLKSSLWGLLTGEYNCGSLDYHTIALNKYINCCDQDEIDIDMLLWIKSFITEYNDREIYDAIKTASAKGVTFRKIILSPFDIDSPDSATPGTLYLASSGGISIFDDHRYEEEEPLDNYTTNFDCITEVMFAGMEDDPVDRYFPAFLDKLSSGYLPNLERLGLDAGLNGSEYLSPWVEWIAMSGIYDKLPNLTQLYIGQDEEERVYEGEELKEFLKNCSAS
jgi:hypothetical protein